jgi:hypothetical protein
MAQTLKFGNGTWATKKGSILAYNDENENYKPLPFNYTGAGKGTRVNKEGLIEVVENDRPRIDYLDSEDGVFLLEKASTNLIAQSNQFDTTWINVNVTLNSGQTGVGGSADAWEVTSISGVDYLRYNASGWSGETTFSVYAKAGTVNSILMTGFGNTFFNLETGVIGTSDADSAKIEPMGDGWFRCSVVGNTDPSQVRIYPSDFENTSAVGSIYIQYAQVESGNLSSYIPTQGSIQTRVQETASGSGNSEVFNDSEGVLFADIAAWADDGTFRKISLNSGSPLQSLVIYYRNTSNAIEIEFSSGAFYQHLLTDSTISTKVSVKYKENDTDIYINGFLVHTITSVAMPVGLSKLDFYNNNTQHFYGKVKEIGYYDEVLTDIELETLTSYRNWESMVNELNLNVIYNG